MAYTAIRKMRRINGERFGASAGPVQPKLFCNAKNRSDLKSAALRFLHSRCEGLLFDAAAEAAEKRTGVYRGTSLAPGQIPYNMQMDINRLCLERALEHFIDTGAAEDAYLVYYCFMKMFLGYYGKSKRMVELLSEYEQNGSSLLMKHRDHYSHSVYVFALGLAVYETNPAYRRTFRNHYRDALRRGSEKPSCRAANLFLEYWGMTALFHDIGYPFELPFEQVMSYFEVDKKKRGGTVFFAYESVDLLTALGDEEQTHFEALYGRRFASTSELFAHAICLKMGEAYGLEENGLADIIRSKPVSPDRFQYFMDHAFFSAVRLYRELVETRGAERIDAIHIDALSAILLHNSLFKFSIAFYKDEEKRKAPLRMDMHPLAWLLMLCDELQCWDRTSYGRNTRTELHPMAADFDFGEGAISGVYYYDMDEQEKIRAFEDAYRKWEAAGGIGDAPRLKAYSDMAGTGRRFTADIERIVDTAQCPLTVVPSMRKVDRKSKRLFLSSSNFLHLYDFAVSLHGRNEPEGTTISELERKFERLSLEYQLSTINRARHFGRYLDAIHCFFTDRPVDYEMVTAFTPEQAAIIAPLEHERWIRDHQAMGWKHGSSYETVPLDRKFSSAEAERAYRQALREQMRCHRLVMDGNVTADEIRRHSLNLPEEDREKDWKPFNSMLKLLKKFDGLRIYRY